MSSTVVQMNKQIYTRRGTSSTTNHEPQRLQFPNHNIDMYDDMNHLEMLHGLINHYSCICPGNQIFHIQK